MQIKITEHAMFEANRRNIAEGVIRSIIESPQQKILSKKRRVILQKKYYDKVEAKEMLLRVIGIESIDQFKVITVYKTSKIDKYWKKGF